MENLNFDNFDFLGKDFHTTLHYTESILIRKVERILNNEHEIEENKKHLTDSILCNMYLSIECIKMLEYLFTTKDKISADFNKSQISFINDNKNKLYKMLDNYKIKYNKI